MTHPGVGSWNSLDGIRTQTFVFLIPHIVSYYWTQTFPTLKSYLWNESTVFIGKKKKNLHVSWTHTVQTPSKVNCKLFLSFREMFIKQFLIMYCSGARLPVVASHLLWQTSSVTFGKLFKLTSHKIFKTVPGT